MQVLLLVGRAGTHFTQNVGDVVTVDDAEGKRMIAAGQAEPVKAKRSSKATTPDKENASL